MQARVGVDDRLLSRWTGPSAAAGLDHCDTAAAGGRRSADRACAERPARAGQRELALRPDDSAHHRAGRRDRGARVTAVAGWTANRGAGTAAATRYLSIGHLDQ